MVFVETRTTAQEVKVVTMSCEHMPYWHSWNGRQHGHCQVCLDCSRSNCDWPGHKRCPCNKFDNCGPDKEVST